MSALLDMTPRFRVMREQDLDVILAIEQRIYPFPWSRGNFADSLSAGYCCTVLETNGVAGYGILSVAAGESHLLNLSIDVHWQRRGLGGALLGYHLELARTCGASMMLLEVRPSNEAARALYTAHGFVQIAIRPGYYPAGERREDALLLRLKL
jgi:ribosomal-protein-alanine N-acetyltransferase